MAGMCLFYLLETNREKDTAREKNSKHTYSEQQAQELKQIRAHKSMHRNKKMTSLQVEI